MGIWKSNSELQLFKRMLYAFSFTTLTCMLCGIDAMNGMSTTFNIVIALLSEVIMLCWIGLAFPDARIRRNRVIINSVARICSTIGLIFVIFASIGSAHFLYKFVYLASMPYLLVGALSWVLLYLYRDS